MPTNLIPAAPALALAATGPVFLAGAVVHPHAPHAQTMAEVAYVQTGESTWWPAHTLLLTAYLLFVFFLKVATRVPGLPARTSRVLAVALPVATFCAAAMAVHLLLPLGRASVANAHDGWALWAKDCAEAADGIWAFCVAAVALSLSGAGLAARRIAPLGVAGGLGFAAFSFVVPLTGPVVPMHFTRSLLHAVPVFAILIAAWAVAAGCSALALRRHEPGLPAHELEPGRAR